MVGNLREANELMRKTLEHKTKKILGWGSDRAYLKVLDMAYFKNYQES